MKNFLSKYWPYIVIFGLGFIVSLPLFRYGYFSHQDDLQIIRIFEMRKCFADFQIPCRWVPDMGWGNGMPIFNFYGVFIYYLGGILSYLTGFIGAAKIIFYLSLVAGSFGIYLLVKSIWGRNPALVSAILYLFAPYKALDAYVRGALAESFALAVIPFVFFFAYKLVASPKENKYSVFFIISLFIFLITHNIMVLIFLPVLLLWIIYWLIETKWINLKKVLLSLVLGVGLSAFFILPAFFEKNLVQTESLTRFELDFRANYLKTGQLFFDRTWGYGTSIPGPEGGMNFQIGWPHWWLVLITLAAIFISKIRKDKKILTAGIFAVFVLSLFMTHNKSTFIWVSVPILKYFQFPWRFLSLSVFTASILGGFVIFIFKNKIQIYLSIAIILLTMLLNWNYFKPKTFYQINDAQKLSGTNWEEQKKGALLDYLPKSALEPREDAPSLPQVRTGSATVTDFINRSNKWSFTANISKAATIEVPVFYFPKWKVFVDGNLYPFSFKDNVLGRISLDLKPGTYKVEGVFMNTPLRTFSNAVSIFSFIVLFIYLYYEKNHKFFKK